MGGADRDEEQAELLVAGQAAVTERPEGLPHDRRPGGIPVGDQRGQPVSEQAGRGATSRRDRCAASGPCHLCQPDRAGQTRDVHRRGQGIEVGLPGQLRVERLKPPGRIEQERRPIDAVPGSERHLPA